MKKLLLLFVLFSLSASAQIADKIKSMKAQLEIIEGGSHDLMLDKDFEKTAEVIKSWLEKK
jgi:alpha-beta hydrolase superfamily lysophospholipase